MNNFVEIRQPRKSLFSCKIILILHLKNIQIFQVHKRLNLSSEEQGCNLPNLLKIMNIQWKFQNIALCLTPYNINFFSKVHKNQQHYHNTIMVFTVLDLHFVIIASLMDFKSFRFVVCYYSLLDWGFMLVPIPSSLSKLL